MANLSAPVPVTLYYDDGRTHEYNPVDLQLQVDRQAGIAVMTWDREDTLNALSLNIVQETLFVLEMVKRDAALKVLVWTAKGRAFCSGAAIKGPGKHAKKPEPVPKALVKEYAARDLVTRFPQDIAQKSLVMACWQFPKVLIGAVNGLAVGGGANMVLCNLMDFVLCAHEAKFKFPFAEIGITPELSSSFILPRQIGFARAKNLLLTGRWYTAAEALADGVVTSCHGKADLHDAAMKLAVHCVKNYAAVSAGKRLINGHEVDRVGRVLDTENGAIHQVIREPGSKFGKMLSKL